MSGKGKGKGASKKAARQQQQQDAARRHVTRQPGSWDRQSLPEQDAGGARDVPGPSRESHITQASAAQAPQPEALAPALVHHYADVAAVRIQDWLGRTPGLLFRRGASALLTKATDPGEWGGLPPGVQWNDQAGHVDGVVSLETDESVADADAPKILLDAALQVARRMRHLMPHCPLQAVAGHSPSYAEAYAGMAEARGGGDYLLDWPPAPPEVILAKPCQQCHQAAATEKNIKLSKDDIVDLCAECCARASYETAGRTSASSARLEPAPERRLREALRGIGMMVTGFSDNFAEMAESGRRGRDDTASQIAVIYADGNRVGAFLSQAAAAKDGPKKSEIAHAIDDTVLGALAAATKACFEGKERPPVLPHLAGGDDLLISVPASDAWLFTLTLIEEFEHQIRAQTRSWPAVPPTLSAGLVFHHNTYPFSDVVRLADDRLRAAKKATSGRESSIAFLDVTADGGEPPEGREALKLTYLKQNADRFRRVAALPGSRRATLLDMARRGDWDGFTARLTDLPNEPLWEFAAGTAKTTAAHVKKALSDDTGTVGSSERRHEVRRALDVARHWGGK